MEGGCQLLSRCFSCLVCLPYLVVGDAMKRGWGVVYLKISRRALKFLNALKEGASYPPLLAPSKSSWRNGSVLDFGSKGCGFKSRRRLFFLVFQANFFLKKKIKIKKNNKIKQEIKIKKNE